MPTLVDLLVRLSGASGQNFWLAFRLDLCEFSAFGSHFSLLPSHSIQIGRIAKTRRMFLVHSEPDVWRARVWTRRSRFMDQRARVSASRACVLTSRARALTSRCGASWRHETRLPLQLFLRWPCPQLRATRGFDFPSRASAKRSAACLQVRMATAPFVCGLRRSDLSAFSARRRHSCWNS